MTGLLSLHRLASGPRGCGSTALVLTAITVTLLVLRLVRTFAVVLLIALVLGNSSGGNEQRE